MKVNRTRGTVSSFPVPSTFFFYKQPHPCLRNIIKERGCKNIVREELSRRPGFFPAFFDLHPNSPDFEDQGFPLLVDRDTLAEDVASGHAFFLAQPAGV